ncbi:MAG TPA: phosphatase PAP2 family protein [Candidatus Sumerlaeota bacterium]|nr:phosphatase PAP2 family protein [Candidatus Sumerlaeota bacterium]
MALVRIWLYHPPVMKRAIIRGARAGLRHARRWIMRMEFVTLVLLVLLAGSIHFFVELADDVLEGDTRELDEWIILGMRNPDDLADPVGPPWLEEMIRDITGLGGIGVLSLVTLGVAGYLGLAGKRHAMVLVLAAVFGGMVASQLLKWGFERPRPDLVPHHSEVYTTSFPSGHSMVSAVTYLTLGALLARINSRRRIKTYVLCLAVLVTVAVGVSRVYLGVHWPTDVVAGWSAGAAWAMACWLAAIWLQKRGAIEAPESPASVDAAKT